MYLVRDAQSAMRGMVNRLSQLGIGASYTIKDTDCTLCTITLKTWTSGSEWARHEVLMPTSGSQHDLTDAVDSLWEMSQESIYPKEDVEEQPKLNKTLLLCI